MVQVPPVPRGPIVDLSTGKLTSAGVDFFERLQDRAGGSGNRGLANLGEITVAASDLASGGTVRLLRARPTEQWKVREIYLSGAGTNFSGGGGDRDLSVTDGTSTWTVIGSGALQSFSTAGRWGDAGLPFPATASHFTASTVNGADIVAQYSGGTTDYTTGSLTLVLWVERAA